MSAEKPSAAPQRVKYIYEKAEGVEPIYINSARARKGQQLSEDLIKRYSTSIVKALIEKSKSLSGLSHKETKGVLRELFVREALRPFLASNCDIGSGIIINQRGIQSNQTDIVIYDNRILPPFIKQQNIGVFPVESVLATIEVKSNLRKTDIDKAETDAKLLCETIHRQQHITSSISGPDPYCALFGFYGRGTKKLSEETEGRAWLAENVRCLQSICLANMYSWVKSSSGWSMRIADSTSNEETKGFIADVIDSVRRITSLREVNLQLGPEWLKAYISNSHQN